MDRLLGLRGLPGRLRRRWNLGLGLGYKLDDNKTIQSNQLYLHPYFHLNGYFRITCEIF